MKIPFKGVDVETKLSLAAVNTPEVEDGKSDNTHAAKNLRGQKAMVLLDMGETIRVALPRIFYSMDSAHHYEPRVVDLPRHFIAPK